MKTENKFNPTRLTELIVSEGFNAYRVAEIFIDYKHAEEEMDLFFFHLRQEFIKIVFKKSKFHSGYKFSKLLEKRMIAEFDRIIVPQLRLILNQWEIQFGNKYYDCEYECSYEEYRMHIGIGEDIDFDWGYSNYMRKKESEENTNQD